MLKYFAAALIALSPLSLHAQPAPSPDSQPAGDEPVVKPIEVLPSAPTEPPKAEEPTAETPAQAEPAPPPAAPTPEPEPTPRAHFEETYKPSSESGEPIFDWSKHKGEREVKHPFAEKGLIRITKDRDYLYKVQESAQTRAFDFRVGLFNPTKLANPETGRTFADTYDSPSGPALIFDYEWQLFRGALGKLGLTAGAGAFVAQGHGHFASGVNADKTPREVFTFVLVPLNVGPVYRLEWYHRQLFVPYVAGGGSAFGFTEMRDDDKPPKFGAAYGAYYAGGLGINLTYFDSLSRINLDREYGINAIFLTLEYRGIVALSKSYDFSSDFLNAGFLLEF